MMLAPHWLRLQPALHPHLLNFIFREKDSINKYKGGFQVENTSLLLTHMEDFARQAQKTGMAHSKFLTPTEAELVRQGYAGRRDVLCAFDGGFPEAERSIAVFTQPDWGIYERKQVLKALTIRFRPQDTLRHQDILGAILGLGLSRDILGDIYIQSGSAFTVCLASIADFIQTELRKAGRVGVSVLLGALSELPDLSPILEEKQLTVSSLRLDAVLSAAFNLSRSESGDLIRAGHVQVNHRECLSISGSVSCGDIVSVRGKGRFKLLAFNDYSRKGKPRITIGVYT